MRFEISFHGPFRVATGSALEGLDATYDELVPLPGSSLKGLMRAHAGQLLGVHDTWVEAVFGSRTQPCPWHWSDATVTDAVGKVRSRIEINDATWTTADKALLTAAEIWPVAGSFDITNRAHIEDAPQVHEAILSGSARAVTALGSDRRRGLGWVSITPERAWDDELLEALRASRSPHA